MNSGANRFYNSVDGAAGLTANELVSYFVYFLTVELGEGVATTKSVDECFQACDLPRPKNVSAALSKGLGGAQKFVKVDGGYRLHRNHRDELAKRLKHIRNDSQTSRELRKLELQFPAGTEKAFLTEAIDCFEAGANRATIVMSWILTLDHLYDFVLQHHISEFNAELAKVTDKRVKVQQIRSRDDFTEIPENKFIELLRAAGIISNDVRKILDEKLGTRNSSAHPSSIAIKPSKVVEFVDDLIENIVLKYRV